MSRSFATAREMHHPITDHCPICLEDIKIKPSGSVVKIMIFFLPVLVLMLSVLNTTCFARDRGNVLLCQAGFTESKEERNNVLIKADPVNDGQ